MSLTWRGGARCFARPSLRRWQREAGYHTISLWTVSSLIDARRLYERAEYRLVAAEPERAFGQEIVNETWELRLTEQG